MQSCQSEHKIEQIRNALQLYERTRHSDYMARTKEDFASVEENYLIVFNTLKESPAPRHRQICADILSALARRLESENRPDSARTYRNQAKTFRHQAAGRPRSR